MVQKTTGEGGENPSRSASNQSPEGGGLEAGDPCILELVNDLNAGAGGRCSTDAGRSPEEGASPGAEARLQPQENRSDQDPDGQPVSTAHGDKRVPRVKTGPWLTPADIARALRLAGGDYKIAAGALGTTPARLRAKVHANPQLRAAFSLVPVTAPNETNTISRSPGKVEVTDSELADELRKQEFDIMRGGLEKAGIKPETLQKLAILDGLSPNAGRFLVASMDLSHKMMIYQNIQLLEQADYIKKNYLEDESLSSEFKIEWQKAYNEICDIIGKGYDRTLAGTQAMAKIMQGQAEGNAGGEKPGKRRPAFTTLKAAHKVDAPKN